MSRCILSPERLALLVQGSLSAALRQQLALHLESDCPDCAAALAEAGLDEETLLLHLFALEQPAAAAASLERVWVNVETTSRAAAPRAASVEDRPWRWLFGDADLTAGLKWGLAGLATATVAALVVLVGLPVGPRPDAGVKGARLAPQASLALVAVSEAPGVAAHVFEARYGVDRDAHVVVLHARPGTAPTLLFAGEVEAAPPGAGRLSTAAGFVAYDVRGEPGPHLFVLAASMAAIDVALVVGAVEPGWSTAPPAFIERDLGGTPVGIAARVVTGAGAPER
ncbi:MAG: hypothetical protein HY903_01790 [Deltaproteobacteria bacterium]|nr:hypothetical protein [Deltaproteobacteria bacterium]